MTTAPTTQSIVINLDQLKALMLEFIAARGGRQSNDEELLRQLTLSEFLLWLRQKENDEQKKVTSSFASVGFNRSADRRPASYRLGSVKK